MSLQASGAFIAPVPPRNRQPNAEQQPSSPQKAPSSTTTPNPQPTPSPSSWFKPRLLRKDELPPWYDANSFIRSGYRPISQSTRQCLASLFYMHNESMNIYTHLVPGLVTLSAVGYMMHLFQLNYPQAAADDLAVFGFFIFTAVSCMGLSALYHTMTSHSEPFDQVCLRADYSGIVLLMLGCFVSGIKMAFFCEPLPRLTYWTMIFLLGSVTLVVVLSPFYSHPKFRNLRLSAFVGTAMSGFAPIIHGLIKFGWNHMWQASGMPYYFLEGALFLSGVFFYVTRLPESVFPEVFDVFGASHQIFHVFVVLATLAHSKGIFEAYDYNYHNRKCLA